MSFDFFSLSLPSRLCESVGTEKQAAVHQSSDYNWLVEHWANTLVRTDAILPREQRKKGRRRKKKKKKRKIDGCWKGFSYTLWRCWSYYCMALEWFVLYKLNLGGIASSSFFLFFFKIDWNLFLTFLFFFISLNFICVVHFLWRQQIWIWELTEEKNHRVVVIFLGKIEINCNWWTVCCW